MRKLLILVLMGVVACKHHEIGRDGPMVAFRAGGFVGTGHRCLPMTLAVKPDALFINVRQHVPAFTIDREVVTCTELHRCIGAGECEKDPAYWGCYNDIAAVEFDVARQFCAWRRARIPSYAEWQRAARTKDGWVYPTGDKPLDELPCRATTPDHPSFPRCEFESPEGFRYGLNTNVGEWTADIDCEDPINSDRIALGHLSVNQVRELDWNFVSATSGRGEFRCARDAVDIPTNPGR